MKTHLLKTSQGIALEINGVVSDCKLEFSEEVSKGIGELWGIWDVVDLAVERTLEHNYESIEQDSASILGFKDGFNKYQLLNKEKLFTMEDMEKAIDFGLSKQYYVSADSFNSIREGFVSSLLPERVECTVEMEENQCDGCKANLPLIGNVHQCSYPTGNISCQKEKYNRPKITDGKYRVLTLIKN